MNTNSGADFTEYDRYIESNFDSMVEELRQFCSQPTLAGQRIGWEEGPALVEELLQPLGASTRLLPVGDAPPVVFCRAGRGRAYLADVQPLRCTAS